MTLTDLGFNQVLESFIRDNNLSDYTTGRVTQEHRERYIVSTGDNEYEAEITGNLRFSASSRADFPAVGDWVTMTVYDSDLAIIHRILPRISVLERQAVGKSGEIQIISANIDIALIVQSINNNFNINRLERYISICYSSRIEPVLVISKIDLVTGSILNDAISKLEVRDKKIKYILLSNLTRQGLDQILEFLQKGKTYCVVGSSGVGKSTLINNLLKKNILKTGNISNSTNKGRHISDHRELFVLENGAIIIDTPGMRELGNIGVSDGIEESFSDITELSNGCRFTNCTHTNEPGCSLLAAVHNGELSEERYESYLKLLKESEYHEMSYVEKRRKDRKFGQFVKTAMKEHKKKSP